MWYLLSKNKFFSVAAICTALAVLIVVFTGVQIRAWSFEIQDVRSEKARNELLVRNFEKQLALYRSGFSEKMEQLFTVRPTEDQLVSFLNSMDKVAMKSGVGNFSINSTEKISLPSEPLSSFPILSYEVSLEATPKTLGNFLAEFDKLPYYLWITDFTLQKKQNVSFDELIDIFIIFRIFIRLP